MDYIQRTPFQILQGWYLPPEEALRVGLQTLKDKEVDLIVILSSISDDNLEALLDSPSIASVALSTHGSLLDDPHHAKKDPTRPLIVETPDRGRYVQISRHPV